jgi:predicted sulfurtransferase
MKKGTLVVLATVALGCLVVAVLSIPSLAKDPAVLSTEDVPRISKEEVKAMLGKPDAIIIDVRISGPLPPGEPKIKGAIVEDPRKVQSWMGKYPKDKTIVFYCT